MEECAEQAGMATQFLYVDEIGLTLAHADKIRAFEDARKQSLPWFYV